MTQIRRVLSSCIWMQYCSCLSSGNSNSKNCDGFLKCRFVKRIEWTAIRWRCSIEMRSWIQFSRHYWLDSTNWKSKCKHKKSLGARAIKVSHVKKVTEDYRTPDTASSFLRSLEPSFITEAMFCYQGSDSPVAIYRESFQSFVIFSNIPLNVEGVSIWHLRAASLRLLTFVLSINQWPHCPRRMSYATWSTFIVTPQMLRRSQANQWTSWA